MVTSSGVSGALAGSAVSMNRSAGGTEFGSSRIPPSCERCQRFAIARVDLRVGRGDRNVVRGGVGEGVLAAADVPLAPRRDDRELRREGGVGELEAHLVVPLAGAAVRERVGADGARDLDLALGDERPRHGGAEEVLAAVDRAGAERGPDEIGDELLAQVLDVALVGAGGDRLCANAVELVALADVGGDADDSAS